MLFAISGSQGSGKTTVLNKLIYPSIERKTSRSIQKEWGYTLEEINADHDLTAKFQEAILARKQIDEEAAVNSPLVHFTERTYADLFTYALITLGKESKFSDFLNKYYERCMTYQQDYQHVFYIKGGHFTIEHDVHRAASNPHYVRMVDLTMFDVTQAMTRPGLLTIIETPSIHQRVVSIALQTQGIVDNG